MDSEVATAHASPVNGSISMIFLLQRNQSDESPSAMDTECTLDKRPVYLEEEKSVSDFKKATHTRTHARTHTHILSPSFF